MYAEWKDLDGEYNDLVSIGDVLNTSSSLQTMQKDILEKVVSCFGADSGNFCLHNYDKPVASKGKTALVNLSWRYTEQYIEYYHDIDPLIHIMPQLGAFRDNDIIPRSSWRCCEFNDDFIKPQKVSHLLVIRIHDANKLIGHIGVFHSDYNSSFSKKDLFKAQYLSSIFSQNLRLKQATQQSNDLNKLLDEVVHASFTEVVVLDSGLIPIYWNARPSGSILSDFIGQGETNHFHGYSPPVLPRYILNECIKIKESLNNKSGFKFGNRHLALWTDHNQQVDVEIIVLPLKGNSKYSEAHNHRFYFLLILNHVRRSNFGSNTVSQKQIVLTGKEKEIAKYVCMGLTNKEISQKLCISMCTVATHVQHIYHKLGVQRRSQLIHELLS